MKLLKPLIVTAASLWILSYFLPTINISDWTTLLLASIVMVLVNQFVRPIVKVLFLPINIVTLGLFSIVINVAMLWLVTYLVPGFQITNMIVLGIHLNQFFSILLASILIGLIQSGMSFIL
ncbi:MAG TPA: phage holin family protein [Patescibacteria group bacterium]|jgi:putative membrane protein